VAPVPEGGLDISSDGRSATLEMKDVAIVDQPKWPAYDAQPTSARLSFRVVWKATDEKVNFDDPLRQYRIVGFRATVQMEASVDVPAIGFSWKSDPLSTSRANFGVIGQEVNGYYYAPA
jgi:hypothetical protein